MSRLVRNNLAVYDDLATAGGTRAARSRTARWLAPPRRADQPAVNGSSVLVDIAGRRLLQPYAAGKGYVHIGLGHIPPVAAVARSHGRTRDPRRHEPLPLADECADVVVAGGMPGARADPTGWSPNAAGSSKPGGVLIVDNRGGTRSSPASLALRCWKTPPPGYAAARHPRPPALRRPPAAGAYVRRTASTMRLTGLRRGS